MGINLSDVQAGQVPQLPSLPPPLGGTGLPAAPAGSKLTSFLQGANPYVSAAMGAIDFGGQIAQLFRKTPDNQDKETATNAQQNIENVIFTIDRQVKDGTMRPEAALIALDSLAQQATALGGTSGQGGGNERFAMGAQTAQLLINQEKATIQSKLQNNYDSYVNAPWRDPSKPNTNPMAGSTAPDATNPGIVSSLSDAGGNEALQNTRIRTGLRNYLTGSDSSLANTPLTSGMVPKDPYSLLPKAKEAAAGVPGAARPASIDPYGMKF